MSSLKKEEELLAGAGEIFAAAGETFEILDNADIVFPMVRMTKDKKYIDPWKLYFFGRI